MMMTLNLWVTTVIQDLQLTIIIMILGLHLIIIQDLIMIASGLQLTVIIDMIITDLCLVIIPEQVVLDLQYNFSLPQVLVNLE